MKSADGTLKYFENYIHFDGLESRENGANHATHSNRNVGTNFAATGGVPSVGIVCSRTKATELDFESSSRQ
jgi:hypothetical protein